MKKIQLFLLLIAILFFLNNDTASVDKVAKINFLIGKTYVIKKAHHQVIEAKLGLPLYIGDRIETKKESRCEILYDNGNVVRLDENSIYRIAKIDEKAKESESELSLGKLWANIVKLFSGAQKFRVKTPTAVAAVRGTVYQIRQDTISADFKVFDGTIGVTPLIEGEPSDSTFVVDQGEAFTMVSNFEEYMKQQEEAFQKFMKEQEEAFQKFMEQDQQAFEEFKKKDAEDFERFKNYHVLKEKLDLEKEKKDEWVRWNMERDKIIEQQRKSEK
ncbi:MAG: hypothetical protein D6732_13040 [Methanobacteriota archaeon]|nr:MAG: hypothetical protein D6732_13040 [Euryarchaeota archaeon]